ncbi:hypothetical protein FQR65_LT00482 [Abscondita terminalis]|nr:hypothetical protein FQR65_LT00482 [Abscondita terminalis]
MFFVLVVVTFFAVSGTCTRQVPPNVRNVFNNLTDPYKAECLGTAVINLVYYELMIDHGYVTNDRPFGCFLQCMFNKIGVYKSDGEFDVASILEKVSYMNETLTQTCVDETESEPDFCIKSLIGSTCVLNALSTP